MAAGIDCEKEDRATGRLDVTADGVLWDMWLESLARGARMPLRIAGKSMTPFVHVGDRVTVSRVIDTRSIRRGDVVLLRLHGCLVVHRIIARSTRRGEVRFRQKGDAGLESGAIAIGDIIGRVVRIEPADGGHGRDELSLRAINRTLWPLSRAIDLVYRTGRWAKRRTLAGDWYWADVVCARAKRMLRAAQERVIRRTSGASERLEGRRPT